MTPIHSSPATGQSTATVRFMKLDDRATIPQYQTQLAAGLDLAACLPRHDTPETVTVNPGDIVKIPLGFAVAIPPGYEGQIRPRSGLATKQGLTIPNAPGTVDADYRGEMFVALINLGKKPIDITHQMRIAQLIIAPVSHATILEVDSLDETTRGTGGFGSTGH
ncbi:MAG: dUTP diphosphatase [Phycisphaerales bacterium]|nr:dUTP diphosphatase [Phycisphaerales bacterium]